MALQEISFPFLFAHSLFPLMLWNYIRNFPAFTNNFNNLHLSSPTSPSFNHAFISIYIKIYTTLYFPNLHPLRGFHYPFALFLLKHLFLPSNCIFSTLNLPSPTLPPFSKHLERERERDWQRGLRRKRKVGIWWLKQAIWNRLTYNKLLSCSNSLNCSRFCKLIS